MSRFKIEKIKAKREEKCIDLYVDNSYKGNVHCNDNKLVFHMCFGSYKTISESALSFFNELQASNKLQSELKDFFGENIDTTQLEFIFNDKKVEIIPGMTLIQVEKSCFENNKIPSDPEGGYFILSTED